MRIVCIVVIGSPEKGPNYTRTLYGTEGQAQNPHHGGIFALLQRDVMRGERLGVLGILLESVCVRICQSPGNMSHMSYTQITGVVT